MKMKSLTLGGIVIGLMVAGGVAYMRTSPIAWSPEASLICEFKIEEADALGTPTLDQFKGDSRALHQYKEDLRYCRRWHG